MAFASGKESTESSVIKRYIGVAPVFVLGVNPSKQELEQLYGTEIEKAPEYVGEIEVEQGGSIVKIPQVRLDFIIKTDPEKCNGIEFRSKISLFLRKSPRYTKDGSKIQVINKYGVTTWLPLENLKNKTIPTELSWFDPLGMRAAYAGEEELVEFLKAYLNIPNKSYRKKNGEVVTIANPTEAEAQLDSIENYFKNDFSELKGLCKLLPNNKLKVLFGVKSSDGKMYQDVYTRLFLKNGVSEYTRLEEHLANTKSNGAYPNTEFKVCDIKEYEVESTDFTKVNSSSTPSNPFANPSQESSPFEGPMDDSPWFK